MNNDLISREALLKAAKSPCENCKETMKSWCEHCCPVNDFVDIINNAPTVKPCENCDLYFMAKTKEEMRKGGAE